ncbi:MAG: glycosyltransferase [Acutalibacteraceae bacterium]
MKIGLFNDSFPPTIDGVSNCVYNYAVNLSGNHVRPEECTVVTPKYPHVKDDYPFEVYRYSSADISKRIGYRVGNMFSPRMLKYLNDKRFDIVHVHSPFTSMVIASELKKMRAGVPIIFTYHTKFDIDFKKRLRVHSLCKMAERFIVHNINAADEVWVVSEGAVQSLRNIGYKGECRVMKNGTDFRRGKAGSAACAALRAELHIAEDEKMLLFVGRMMWYKNIGLILDSLARLGGSVKYKMVFVGDGDDRAAMEDYARSLGIGDKTTFVGAVHDREKLREYFSAADLFLFPSTYDTAGLVVMEAAACDLPSVLIDGSCAAEDVVDGFSGFLCMENVKSMADKILYALADDERRGRIGKNAGECVYLSWEDAVARSYKRYCEIYNEFHGKKFKKSIIEKALPSNIKNNIKNTAVRGGHAAREITGRVSNAGRTAAESFRQRVTKAAEDVRLRVADALTSGIRSEVDDHSDHSDRNRSRKNDK